MNLRQYLTVFLVLSTGCFSKPSSIDEMTRAICERWEECLGAESLQSQGFGSVDDCATTVAERYAEEADGCTFSKDAAQLCVETHETTECDGYDPELENCDVDEVYDCAE